MPTRLLAPTILPRPLPRPPVWTPPADAAAREDVSESEHSNIDRLPRISVSKNVKFMFSDSAYNRCNLFRNICVDNLLDKCNAGWCRQRHVTLEQHLLKAKELHNNCIRRVCISEYLAMKGHLMNTSIFNDYAQLFMDCFISKNKVRFMLEVVIDYYRTGTYMEAMDRGLAGISDFAALDTCLDVLAYRLEDGKVFIHTLLNAISQSNSNHIQVCIKLLSIAERVTESIDMNTALMLVKKACEVPLNEGLVRATFYSVVCKTAPAILGHKKAIEQFANVLNSLNLKRYNQRLSEMVEKYKTQAGDRQNESEKESERPFTNLPESNNGRERYAWKRPESSNATGSRPAAPGLMSVNVLRNNGPEHTQYPSYTRTSEQQDGQVGEQETLEANSGGLSQANNDHPPDDILSLEANSGGLSQANNDHPPDDILSLEANSGGLSQANNDHPPDDILSLEANSGGLSQANNDHPPDDILSLEANSGGLSEANNDHPPDDILSRAPKCRKRRQVLQIDR